MRKIHVAEAAGSMRKSRRYGNLVGTRKVVEKLSAVGHCDDVFFDQKRKPTSASGGDGAISVFEQHDLDHYKELARISTVKGARTSFFSPDLDRLYLAVRRQGSTSAMIQVFEAGQ